jgi:hypothetical protein
MHKCEICGFEKELNKYDSQDCPLCGGYMEVEKNKNKEKIIGNNFLDMKKEIKNYGNNEIWQIIERFKDVKVRIGYRQIFLKAGGQVPEIKIEELIK